MIHSTILLRALNPILLVVAVCSVLLGWAGAVVRDKVEVLPLVLCFLFAIVAQAAANCAYGFSEYRATHGNSVLEQINARFRNPDTYTSHEEISSNYTILRELAMVFGLFALTIGIVLASHGGVWAFMAGLVLLILLYINVLSPAPLSRTPFSMIVAFMVFGPFATVCTALLITTPTPLTMWRWADIAPAMYLGCSGGFLVVAILILGYYIGFRADIYARRQSLVTAIGIRATRILFLLMGLGCWITFYLMVNTLYLQHPVIDMVAPSLALTVNTGIWWYMSKVSTMGAKMRLFRLALLNLAIFSLLTFLVFTITGRPDPLILEYL